MAVDPLVIGALVLGGIGGGALIWYTTRDMGRPTDATHCPDCGSKLNPNDAFCPACGTQV